MRYRHALVASAALGVFFLSGTGVSAATAPRHKSHHKAPPAPSPETVELRQEVQTLTARLQALESRLDAQTEAQRQTQAQVQSAQTTAQAAQTAAQAAQVQEQADASKIETLPAQIDTAARAAAPKPGWWNNTTVGSTIFADVSNIDNRNAAGKTAQSGTDYDIKRAYIIIDHRFNDVFSSDFTTDFTYDSTTKATQLYIKKAYLQAKVSDAFTVRAGAAELPWVPFVEGLYGYRYVEKVLLDLNGFGTTTDWGVHAFGSLFDHIVSYQVSVVDGEGYKIPATGTANRTNAVDVEGRLSATYDHFTLGIGGYDGKLGADVTGTPTYHTAQRFDAIAAYTSDRFRLGFEYLWARYYGASQILQPIASKTNVTDGYSGFASYNFTKKVSVFGRYDWLKPLANTAPSEYQDYFNVGVAYKPIPPIDLALVYKRDNVYNGSFTSQNGTIGIPTGATKGEGNYDEFGLFTSYKF